MDLFFLIVGICWFSAQVTRFLVWVDDPQSNTR